MKDLSLFLLKNTFGAKMIKKGLKSFCNGENSTSILDQKGDLGGASSTCTAERPVFNSPVAVAVAGENAPTLEEMIMQLEVEEKIARKNGGGGATELHRMSCVNSSDILRTARNALNQYPRFSLDGKDAMYRSSFTNLVPVVGRGRLPDMVGGESVIWCKPGVVGKLMGLEAIPVPLTGRYRRERLSAIVKRQSLRKRADMERRRDGVRRSGVGSCSRTGYCFMKPIDMDINRSGEPRLHVRRLR